MIVRISAGLVLFASLAVAEPPPSAEDARAKVDALRAALKSDKAEDQVAAVAAAGTVAHPSCAAALAPLLTHPSDDLRLAAASALGEMKGMPEAAKALAGAVPANAKKADVLKAILTSLGTVNHPSAVPALEKLAKDRVPLKDEKDSDLAVAAINALASLKWKASVVALLDLYKKQVGIGMKCSAGIHAPVYNAIQEGLRTLTGATINGLPSDADAWWRQNKDRFADDMTEKKK